MVASPPTEVLPLRVSASSAETRTELPPLTRASTTSPVDSVSRSSRCIPKSSKTEVVELLCVVLLLSKSNSVLIRLEA